MKFDRKKMLDFFHKIWKTRVHVCGSCGNYLGKEPASYNFEHLLPKEKYPEIAYEEWNIMLVCLGCHDQRHFGNLSDKYIDKINEAKEIYESKSILQMDKGTSETTKA